MSRAIVLEAVWKVPLLRLALLPPPLHARSSDALLLEFWAPWCKPCETLEPVLEALPRASSG